jgi:hypothetical protein
MVHLNRKKGGKGGGGNGAVNKRGKEGSSNRLQWRARGAHHPRGGLAVECCYGGFEI